jgi:hypothetical protein
VNLSSQANGRRVILTKVQGLFSETDMAKGYGPSVAVRSQIKDAD